MKIFLCHSSNDKKYVRELHKRLVSDDYDVWLDEINLIPGQEWDPEIRKQVRKSDIVLVCLSDNSANKEGYVQREIRIALDEADTKPEGTIYVIPVRIEPCNIPDRLTKWQWVDLVEENGYSKLKLAFSIREAQVAARDALGTSPTQVVDSSFDPIPMPKRKKIVTELDRNRFAQESYTHIKQYFQRALEKLEAHFSDTVADLRDVSAQEYTCKVYISGQIGAQCTIWLNDDPTRGAIYYSEELITLHICILSDWSDDGLQFEIG